MLDKQIEDTHPQLSISQDTEGRKEQKTEMDEKELRVLTRTLANLSSSSPGSGMGSFSGMLCPLKSGCCSMLPAFPMVPLQATFNPQPFRSLTLPLLPEKGEKESSRCGRSLFGFFFCCCCSLVTSLRACEESGVIRRRLRAAAAALRPAGRHFQGKTGDGIRLDAK